MDVFKLHKLIKSLKKEEKRTFKLSTKKYNQQEESIYLKMFNYLDKQEVISKAKFKAKFKQAKGLSGIQRYLYKQIIKSLRNTKKAQQNITLILTEGIAELEILYVRELTDIAKEKLEELLNLAELHDQIIFLPILYSWWFKLENSRFKYYQVDKATFETYCTKYTETVQTLQQYQTYEITIGELLFEILINAQNSRQVFDTTQRMQEKLPAYVPSSNYYSFSTALVETSLRKLMAAALTSTSDIYRYAKQMTAILEAQPALVKNTYRNQYYGAMVSLTTHTPDLQEAEEILERLLTQFIQEGGVNDYHGIVIFTSLINVYLRTRKLDALKALLEEIQPVVAPIKAEGAVNSVLIGRYEYLVMLYYYTSSNYDLALDIIDASLIQRNLHPVLRNTSLFVKAIIYYEQGHYNLLFSFINNFRRHLRKQDALFFFEKKFLSLLTKLTNLPSQQHKSTMKALRDEMFLYLEAAQNHEKEPFIYFNYMGWLDSQINATPFERLYFVNVNKVAFDQ